MDKLPDPYVDIDLVDNEDGYKFCTVVLFRSSYMDGVWIDSCLTEPWENARKAWHEMQGFMKLVDTPTEHYTKQVWESTLARHPSIKEPVNQLSQALFTMTLRARMNPDIKGPYVIHSAIEPTDEVLLDWAHRRLYGGRRTAKTKK